MQLSKSVIISAAGSGSRLSFGHTKALLKIAGKPIIIHHLEQLNDFDDIRIVVGYDAENVIKTVLSYRRDITFVFNHRYQTTSTLHSLYLGTRFARKYIVSLDGDLLVHPKDLRSFLKKDGEIMGLIPTYSDEPVCAKTIREGKKFMITGFTRKRLEYEWTGLLQIKSDRIIDTGTYVYHCVESALPFEAAFVDCREVDTPDDYQRAVEWGLKVFKK